MNDNTKEEKTVKNPKRVIGLIISLGLAVLFCHPGWLPLPQQIRDTMQKLLQDHFLLKGSAGITLAHVLTLIPAFLIVWAVCTVLSLLLDLIGRKNGRAATVTNLLQSIVRYFGVIIALFWGFSILGVNTAAVLASVGIIGLIIGFGAQSLIEDIITGFFIIFEGEYGVGDIIILDDFRGTVRSVGVRTTVIEDAGGNLKIVNNSDIRNLQNRSKNSSLAVCDISVAYGTDMTKLREMLTPELPKIFEKHRDLFISAPVYKGVERFEDSGIVLRFTAETRETDIFVARRALNEEILCLLQRKSVEIPFPQVVVHPAK
jgi:small conductance mechanosensitive channel